MFLVAFQTRTFFAWRLLIPLAHLPYQLKTHTNNYASRGIPTRQHTVTNIRRCIKMSVKPTWFCCIELIWLFKQCVVKVFQIFNLESMSKNWQKPKAKSKKQKQSYNFTTCSLIFQANRMAEKRVERRVLGKCQIDEKLKGRKSFHRSRLACA